MLHYKLHKIFSYSVANIFPFRKDVIPIPCNIFSYYTTKKLPRSYRGIIGEIIEKVIVCNRVLQNCSDNDYQLIVNKNFTFITTDAIYGVDLKKDDISKNIINKIKISISSQRCWKIEK